jgi:hypothetical protein
LAASYTIWQRGARQKREWSARRNQIDRRLSRATFPTQKRLPLQMPGGLDRDGQRRLTGFCVCAELEAPARVGRDGGRACHPHPCARQWTVRGVLYHLRAERPAIGRRWGWQRRRRRSRRARGWRRRVAPRRRRPVARRRRWISGIGQPLSSVDEITAGRWNPLHDGPRTAARSHLRDARASEPNGRHSSRSGKLLISSCFLGPTRRMAHGPRLARIDHSF